jgi:signal transduction histidine kinase
VATKSVGRTNVPWIAAGAIGLAYCLAALAVVLGPGMFTTFAARAPALATVAGLALFAAGVLSALGSPGPRTGRLFLIAGAIWFAPVWVGWSEGPPVIRGLGALAVPFLVPVVVHMVVTYPGGRARSAATRAFLAVLYAVAALSAVGQALFRDPLRDAHCWDNCTTNPFLVHPSPGIVHAIDVMDRWVVAGAGIVLVALCLMRLWTATGPARRATWPVAAGGAVVGAALVAHSVVLANGPERPADAGFRAIYLGLAAGMILVAAGPILAWIRARVQRRAVGRIVADLGEAPEPGSVQAALARAVGDPGLAIAYWVPSSSRFVDARGYAVATPNADAGGSLTTLVRDGRTLAAISHGAPTADVERGLGAAVRLALENERLQAEALSRAEDIRASRARIVGAGDAERQRLERDLHDGAQQRLLALSYHLRLARTAAEADGADGAVAALLAGATEQALAALADLRGVARGIFPAIRAEAGLGPALATLVDSAPVPVGLDVALDGRLPARAETAAYVIVAESVEDAAARRATGADVEVRRDGNQLVIRFADDGQPRTIGMVHVADRVGALGGTVEAGPRVLRAEIPCA